MKRSKKAALVLMAPAASLLVAGCSTNKDPALVYGSLQECISSGINSEEQCRLDYAKAERLHPTVAPKYVSRAECEADFGPGKCEEAPKAGEGGSHSSGFFMPMMMGFLAGQMMNGLKGGGAQQASGLAPNANTNHVPQPLYKTRNEDEHHTASNQSVGASSYYTGAKNISPSKVAPQQGTVVRRGGFGQASKVYSSGG